MPSDVNSSVSSRCVAAVDVAAREQVIARAAAARSARTPSRPSRSTARRAASARSSAASLLLHHFGVRRVAVARVAQPLGRADLLHEVDALLQRRDDRGVRVVRRLAGVHGERRQARAVRVRRVEDTAGEGGRRASGEVPAARVRVEIGLHHPDDLRRRRAGDVPQHDVAALHRLVHRDRRQLLPSRPVHPRQLAVHEQPRLRVVGLRRTCGPRSASDTRVPMNCATRSGRLRASSVMPDADAPHRDVAVVGAHHEPPPVQARRARASRVRLLRAERARQIRRRRVRPSSYTFSHAARSPSPTIPDDRARRRPSPAPARARAARAPSRSRPSDRPSRRGRGSTPRARARSAVDVAQQQLGDDLVGAREVDHPDVREVDHGERALARRRRSSASICVRTAAPVGRVTRLE